MAGNRIWGQVIELFPPRLSLTLTNPNGISSVHWVDTEFLIEVETHNWFEHLGYALTRKGDSYLRLHWLSLGKPPKGLHIDHIDGDTRNSCRNNLRIVSNRGNGLNRKDQSESGAGINWNTKWKNWQVGIRMGKNRIYSPCFKDPNQAIACRDAYLLIAHELDTGNRGLPSKEELRAISDACRRIK